MARCYDWPALRLTSTLASDANGGQGVLDSSVRTIRPGLIAAGPASTVRVVVDDNLDVRRALESQDLTGRVLVIAGGSRSRAACMGGLLAREVLAAGVTAVITDAPIRDFAEIVELGLPVWTRGVTPIAPGKRGGGEVDVAVELAGVTVRPGDWIVADDDGVVVWPREHLDELQARAANFDLAEQQRARSHGHR